MFLMGPAGPAVQEVTPMAHCDRARDGVNDPVATPSSPFGHGDSVFISQKASGTAPVRIYDTTGNPISELCQLDPCDLRLTDATHRRRTRTSTMLPHRMPTVVTLD